MPDALDIALCPKLCRHNPANPTVRGRLRLRCSLFLLSTCFLPFVRTRQASWLLGLEEAGYRLAENSRFGSSFGKQLHLIYLVLVPTKEHFSAPKFEEIYLPLPCPKCLVSCTLKTRPFPEIFLLRSMCTWHLQCYIFLQLEDCDNIMLLP